MNSANRSNKVWQAVLLEQHSLVEPVCSLDKALGPNFSTGYSGVSYISMLLGGGEASSLRMLSLILTRQETDLSQS